MSACFTAARGSARYQQNKKQPQSQLNVWEDEGGSIKKAGGDAVVLAPAPVCVERFQRATDVSANLAALKKVDSWSQRDFVEKGGWATVRGSKPPEQVSAVAKARASLLAPA